MPKEITHWTLAEMAFRGLSDASPLKRIIERHRNLYRIGAVIPDTPFYMLFGEKASSFKEHAERIHDTDGNSFECFLPVLDRFFHDVSEPVLSLLLGITTHFYADAAFHPFVCHYSGRVTHQDKTKNRKVQYRHHLLETHIDLYSTEKGFFRTTDTFVQLFNAIEMDRTTFTKVLATFYHATGRDDFALVKKAIRMDAFIQALFDKGIVNAFFRAVNWLPGIHIGHLVSNFYPIRKPKPGSLFQRPIAYLHPVSGERRCVTMRSLENQTLQHILATFEIIEKLPDRKAVSRAFNDLEGPNLYTGLMGCRQREMRYFNDTQDLMELILT